MCLLAIRISSLEKRLFSSLVHFLIGSLIFLELSCRSCLYIFEINPLSVVSLLKISLFFHSIKAKILFRREFHFKYFYVYSLCCFSIPSTSNFLFFLFLP